VEVVMFRLERSQETPSKLSPI